MSLQSEATMTPTEEVDVELEDVIWNLLSHSGLLSEMKSRISKFVLDTTVGNKKFLDTKSSYIKPERADSTILSLIYEYLQYIGMKETMSILATESPVDVNVNIANNKTVTNYRPILLAMFQDLSMSPFNNWKSSQEENKQQPSETNNSNNELIMPLLPKTFVKEEEPKVVSTIPNFTFPVEDSINASMESKPIIISSEPEQKQQQQNQDDEEENNSQSQKGPKTYTQEFDEDDEQSRQDESSIVSEALDCSFDIEENTEDISVTSKGLGSCEHAISLKSTIKPSQPTQQLEQVSTENIESSNRVVDLIRDNGGGDKSISISADDDTSNRNTNIRSSVESVKSRPLLTESEQQFIKDEKIIEQSAVTPTTSAKSIENLLEERIMRPEESESISELLDGLSLDENTQDISINNSEVKALSSCEFVVNLD